MDSRVIDSRTLFLDLETVPGDATVGMDLTNPPGWEPVPFEPEERQPPRNWKDPGKINQWHVDNAVRAEREMAAHATAQAKAGEQWYRGASLDPYRARIACIGWALGESKPAVIDCVEGEAAGLLDLRTLIEDAKPRHIVAHAGLGFDFPMIQLRALRRGVPDLPRAVWQEKPWDTYLIDTKDWAPRVGRSSRRLDDLCKLFGIERTDNPIGGAEVLDAYIGGRWPEVVAHCRADVRDLREVYRMLAEMRGL